MRFTVLPKHRNLHHPISSVISRGRELLAIRRTRRRRLTLPSVVGRWPRGGRRSHLETDLHLNTHPAYERRARAAPTSATTVRATRTTRRSSSPCALDGSRR